VTRHAPELEALSARLRRFTEAMPPRLRAATLDYVDALAVGRERMAWPTIYFLWPYWVQHDLGRPIDDACREIAFANACLTYGVLLQDRAIDEERRDSAGDVMASNELYLAGVLAYGSLFAPSSPLWPRCRALLRAMWEGLLEEKVTHAAAQPESLCGDDALQRSKVNWLDVAAIALCLGAGRAEMIQPFVEHLDHWAAGCQLIDDFEDHRGDLAAGNYTRLLVEAGVTEPGPSAAPALERFFGGPGLRDYLDRARREYRLAIAACPDGGEVQDHARSLLDDLEALRAPFDALLDVAATCT
jgi:hypothetical protein